MHKFARRLRRGRDDGSALLLTVMVLALVGVLATTMAAITTTNLEGTNRAVASSSAINMSDAAVSQAISYMRSNSLKNLACSPTCATNPWGNSTNPVKVIVNPATGKGFTGWIEPVAPYPQNRPGKYKVHAVGMSDGNVAVRSVTANVQVDRFGFPLGISANELTGGGNTGVVNETMIVTGCVYRRNQIRFSGALDPAYGIPPGVHSARYITETNGSGPNCPKGDSIHAGGACNTAYPYDQDAAGGPIGNPCAAPGNTSLIPSLTSLSQQFATNPGALTAPQIESLKSTALSQNNYYTNHANWIAPTQHDAVMFFDLTKTDPGGLVDLNPIAGYDRPTDLAANDPLCNNPKTLVIVIIGGNMRVNSNTQLAASIFLISPDPYGQVQKSNGTSVMTGTVFANGIDMTGTTDWHMDACFTDNLSPNLFDVQATSYTEVDR